MKESPYPLWPSLGDPERPLNADYFRKRVWYPLLDRAGLRRQPFHALRHTFASLLLQRGERLVYVKEQLGHSSIQVAVDLYAHLIPGANRQAVDRLAEATGCNRGRRPRSGASWKCRTRLEPAVGLEPTTC
ncbi:MAG: tyrosine-type recombinase/integrase [Candidatus Rokubacteria bacterium]|nr:tyrosine-type recombinase/integrase [Candidatus Rokubacteria bacterium]